MVKQIWDSYLGKFVNVQEGGSGSGNFGHSGRPGEQGGSGEGGGNVVTGAEYDKMSWEQKSQIPEIRALIIPHKVNPKSGDPGIQKVGRPWNSLSHAEKELINWGPDKSRWAKEPAKVPSQSFSIAKAFRGLGD